MFFSFRILYFFLKKKETEPIFLKMESTNGASFSLTSKNMYLAFDLNSFLTTFASVKVHSPQLILQSEANQCLAFIK